MASLLVLRLSRSTNTEADSELILGVNSDPIKGKMAVEDDGWMGGCW